MMTIPEFDYKKVTQENVETIKEALYNPESSASQMGSVLLSNAFRWVVNALVKGGISFEQVERTLGMPWLQVRKAVGKILIASDLDFLRQPEIFERMRYWGHLPSSFCDPPYYVDGFCQRMMYFKITPEEAGTSLEEIQGWVDRCRELAGS